MKTIISRREHGVRIVPQPEDYRQPSFKEEVREAMEKYGISQSQAKDFVLAKRRDEATQIAEQAAVRPMGRVGTDPVRVTEPSREKARVVEKRVRHKDKKIQADLRDLVVLRAQAFAAFVLIAESKGLPAHVIDERRLSAIVVEARWDLIPMVLAWIIKEDEEVKRAFDTFADAAKKCMENIYTGSSKANKLANQIISEKYRDMFLQAASVYARKLTYLENSLDRLDVLPVDELQKLVDNGDQLSKRIADLSLRVADELKRREAKKGKSAQDAKWEPVRKFSVDLASKRPYPSIRNAALSIKEEVLEFARTQGISMSASQAEKTITGYLKNGGWKSIPSASKQDTLASKDSMTAS